MKVINGMKQVYGCENNDKQKQNLYECAMFNDVELYNVLANVTHKSRVTIFPQWSPTCGVIIPLGNDITGLEVDITVVELLPFISYGRSLAALFETILFLFKNSLGNNN